MDYQDIIYAKEDGIATITLNRPDTRNALSPEMTESIYKVVADVSQDDKLRVLVLTGTGSAFCSGADVKAMSQEPGQPGGKKRKTNKKMDQLPLLLQRCDKPVIAAINGVAAGGGFDLACACDIRIASDKARFTELFIRRGAIPAMGGTFFLPRLVGIDRACQLIWTGDMIDATEAERIGLVTMVVPHGELESATRELAEKLVKGPPLAIQRAKRAIYDGLGMDLQSTLDYVAAVSAEIRDPEDRKEGARAFLEKRAPVFKGK
ncbi:MAG: enoyl-CoA hydratase/isomerase family protein [Chloroflexi bacterium]|nr:enoyl-CoA hydratase/isomerase family protein [Chloroflexota bacterium]